MFNIVVLSSCGGGNFEAVIKAQSKFNYNVVKLITDRECDAINKAKKYNIPFLTIIKKELKELFFVKLDANLPDDTDLIVLAGFLPILPEWFCIKWEKRIINTHPSLLPKYGGKGMMGVKIQEAVLLNNEEYAGCTAHYVNPGIDTGEIILQSRIKTKKSETAWELGGRVFLEENKTLPKAISIVKERLKQSNYYLKDKVFDGKEFVQNQLYTLKKYINCFVKNNNYRRPLLAILYFSSKDTLKYITLKEKRCFQIGIGVKKIDCINFSEKEIISIIQDLNQNKNVDGILFQLPLPQQYNLQNICNSITPLKDVDCMNNYNLGNIYFKEQVILPCAIRSLLELFQYNRICYKNKSICIFGEMNLLTLPIVSYFSKFGNVNLTNKEDSKFIKILKQSDILISFCESEMKLLPKNINKNISVFDFANISAVDNQNNKSLKIIGSFPISEDLITKISFITKVPGCMGPMTILSLLKNTWKTYCLNLSLNN